jgi:endo-1,3-1,4-beta-glycanase ExoK
VGDGGVTLSLTDKPFGERQYSCAEIRTAQGFGYGTYEVRMRSAAGPGMVTAFFTYVGRPFGKDLPHDEIDFEFLGKDEKSVQLNYFSNGSGHHEKIVAFDFDASTTTNDYAFEWLPDSIRWFTNGRLIHEVKGKQGEPFPTTAGRIFLSIWSGQGSNMEGWLGRFSYAGQPISASFEYVAFTKAGEPCQFPTSVVCKMGIRTDSPE